jgi:hypothetical protein
MQEFYAFAAKAMVVLHMAYTAFVVLGQVAIVIGAWRHHAWIRNFWFRSVHLASIAFVVGESWLGVDCPLTVAEFYLRKLAGQTPQPSEFMTKWIERTVGIEPPLWTLTAVYTLFFATVIWSWWKLPPWPILRAEPPEGTSRPPLPVVPSTQPPQASPRQTDTHEAVSRN